MPPNWLGEDLSAAWNRFTANDRKLSYRQHGNKDNPSNDDEDSLTSVQLFTYKELKKATNDFDNRTFDYDSISCYKGSLQNGMIVMVSILRLRHSPNRNSNFRSFVKTMSRINHPNVIGILGYCIEGDNKMVVYEFIGQYSLADFLYTPGLFLDWPLRAAICRSIACALHKLHKGILPPMVHGNINPDNVLLDNMYNPKIVGFEKARFLWQRYRSDYRYRDPAESVLGGRKLSEMEDVYSFGMLVLEVITGGFKSDLVCNVKGTALVDCVCRLRYEGKVLQIVDLNPSKFSANEVMHFINVALFCVQTTPQSTTSMAEVAEVLSSYQDLNDNVLGYHYKNYSTYARYSSLPLQPVANMEERVSLSNKVQSTRYNSEIVELKEESLHGSSEDIICSSSPKMKVKRPIESTLDNIWEALKDAQHKKIALFGEAGSGKTTVLKSMVDHAITKDLFDEVIYVDMSKPRYKKTLQNDIVRQLSLDTTNSSTENDVSDLIERALSLKKFLLLLDDVPETVNLNEIGISDQMMASHQENGGHVVLATRFSDVCQKISERRIKMEELSSEEAWDLFRSQLSNTTIPNLQEIKPYAKEIIEERRGSPLLVKAVGNAMKDLRDVGEWKSVVQKFHISPQDDSSSDTSSSVQSCWSRSIRFCYGQLKGWDVKMCFLYCALVLGDGEVVGVSVLVEGFINEGLIFGTSITVAEKRGRSIVGKLVNASLLESKDDDSTVEMHNFVKNSALDILLAEEEGYQLLTKSNSRRTSEPIIEVHKSQSHEERDLGIKLDNVSLDKYNTQLPDNYLIYLTRASAQLKKAPDLEEWENAKMIFLMDNKFSSLPSNPNCSNLVGLFLQRNNCLRVIPEKFFDNMPNLKILNLSKTRIKSLPISFSKLKKLQALLLRDCERLAVLPSSIGLDNEFLEVLDLQGTELSELPSSVGELKKLIELRVSFYGSINRNEYSKLPTKLLADGVISKLNLNELGLFVYPGDPRWSNSASDIIGEITKCLNLHALYLHFPEVKDVEQFVEGNQSWKNNQVNEFNFIVGPDFKRMVSLASPEAESTYNAAERCLRFVNGENIVGPVVKVLERATAFYLDHHLQVHSLSDFGIDNMDKLRICIVSDCPKLVEIMNPEEQTTPFLPNLEYLSLNYLSKLERIWFNKAIQGSLVSLRHLSITACHELRYVLISTMLSNLPRLEELVIENCRNLTNVVREDNVISRDEIIVVSKYAIPNSLKVLKLHQLPELEGIWKGPWPPLEYISFYSCPKLNNLHMTAEGASKIKEITAEKSWWEALKWDGQGKNNLVDCMKFL